MVRDCDVTVRARGSFASTNSGGEKVVVRFRGDGTIRDCQIRTDWNTEGSGDPPSRYVGFSNSVDNVEVRGWFGGDQTISGPGAVYVSPDVSLSQVRLRDFRLDALSGEDYFYAGGGSSGEIAFQEGWVDPDTSGTTGAFYPDLRNVNGGA